MRAWVSEVADTHYCWLGDGPDPFPYMVREFQSIIGREARGQCAALPRRRSADLVVACVGGGRTRPDLLGIRRHISRSSAWRQRAVSAIGRASRGPPRDEVPAAPRRGGPDQRGPLHLGGTGLSGIGPEHAHLAPRAGRVHPGGRRRGDRRALHTGRDEGSSARSICARPRLGAA